ncbi:MAG: protein serine/threonine phosphatase 2C family protein [Armatimonadetes bacterium]|nr:protein serine/threonine phosphatase 2C family protein [Armatimonadota bacterium]
MRQPVEFSHHPDDCNPTLLDRPRPEPGTEGLVSSESLELWTATDVGLVRQENQDACFVCSYPDNPHAVVCTFAVADGVAGAPSGRLAAHAAVARFRQALDPTAWQADWETILSRAFEEANRLLVLLGMTLPEARTMASTLTGGLILRTPEGLKLVLGHLGDSRAYWIEGRTATRSRIFLDGRRSVS